MGLPLRVAYPAVLWPWNAGEHSKAFFCLSDVALVKARVHRLTYITH